MRKYLLPLIFTFLAFCQAFGQTTLPNMNLEDWVSVPWVYHDTLTGSYDSVAGGVWVTANRAVLLNPTYFMPTTFKTSDAYSGSWAAKIVTDMTENGLLVTGTLATGRFDIYAPPPDNLKMGVPFTGRPIHFKTWIKYFPVEHDSCDIWCMLLKWNPQKMARDTISVAWYTDTITYTQYYHLDIPFKYYSDAVPDTVSIVYAPSASGDLFLGQPGSTLYVDEITLEYSSGFNQILMPEVGVKYYPSPATDLIRFDIREEMKDAVIQIFNGQGQLLASKRFSGQDVLFNLAGFTPGTYYYLLSNKTTQLNSGTFLKTGN